MRVFKKYFHTRTGGKSLFQAGAWNSLNCSFHYKRGNGMKNTTGVICIAAFLITASCDDAGQMECSNEGQIQLGLFGGTTDTDHMAVIILLNGCTATLVAPDRLLTAAHCVCPPILGVRTGPNCNWGEGKEPITHFPNPTSEEGFPVLRGNVFVHPQFIMTLNSDGYVVDSSHDVAVIKLYTPISGITPIAIAKATPELCDQATIVGFGYNQKDKGGSGGSSEDGGGKESDGASGAGIRRDGIVTMTSITSDIVETHTFKDETAIFALPGDSGGPLLIWNDEGVEELVGVTSHGNSRDRTSSTNAVTYREWILSQ